MQAGSRRRDRAALAREYRLVARFVGGFGMALDVRRQRQFAMPFDEFDQIFMRRKAEPVELALAAEHFDLEGVGQAQAAAGLRRLAGAHLGQRFMRAQRPFDQDFDLPAAVLAAVQARMQHAGIVENQQVAGFEQVGKIA